MANHDDGITEEELGAATAALVTQFNQFTANVNAQLIVFSGTLDTHTHPIGDVTGLTDEINRIDQSIAALGGGGAGGSVTADADTVAIRDNNADLHAHYFWGTHVSVSHTQTTRNADTIFYSSIDGYIRRNTKQGFLKSLGLDNVTNTSDAEAGISVATQGALDALQSSITDNATAISTKADATATTNALNTKADATATTTALNGKAATSHTHATGEINGLADLINGQVAASRLIISANHQAANDQKLYLDMSGAGFTVTAPAVPADTMIFEVIDFLGGVTDSKTILVDLGGGDTLTIDVSGAHLVFFYMNNKWNWKRYA